MIKILNSLVEKHSRQLYLTDANTSYFYNISKSLSIFQAFECCFKFFIAFYTTFQTVSYFQQQNNNLQLVIMTI